MAAWDTAWWRTGARPRRRRLSAGAVRGSVVGTVLCVVAALPGAGTAAFGQASGAAGGYDFAEGARTVAGAGRTTDAVRLEPGRTYRSSVPANATLLYRLELDDTSTAYVPVTAVPPADATVTATDGIRVRMRNADGDFCSYGSARFGAGLSPRPVTALAMREAGRTLCRDAGTYYVVVERVAATGADTTPSGDWDLELAPAEEPRPAAAGPTDAPQVWDSASPEALTGEPRRRDGGAGFASARALGQGVWQTAAEPGQTLFYKVPVDWGQQVHATAGLDSSRTTAGGGHGGYVSGALNLSLYNPARGYVDDVTLAYSGNRKTAALEPLPPVEYRNRYSALGEVRGTRFAGAYYLVVHLNGQMGDTFGHGSFPVTLRVRVSGDAHAGPGYAGPSDPRNLFEVTAADRAAAVTGSGGPGGGTGGGDSAGGGTVMQVLAVAGIGTGSALLLGLGAWTAVARRRAGIQLRANAQKPTA